MPENGAADSVACDGGVSADWAVAALALAATVVSAHKVNAGTASAHKTDAGAVSAGKADPRSTSIRPMKRLTV